ncbi:histone-lysine N-methyltransferase SETMAR-like [Temnothorax nylanderi]|uniref:histone-lysine N-methyltransferase SETMAR-like n=1 Tax=Temnothorax nylanderi TaxID=102681 RepID=UPI003A84AFD4
MDNKTQQRANIKFCAKLGVEFGETYKMIKMEYGNNRMSYHNARYWYNQFHDGREDISDASKISKTISRSTEEVEKVLEILRSDRYVPTSVVVELTGIHERTVYRILKQNLGKRKICERFVPRTLTDDQKDARVKHCKDMRKAADTDSNFMKNIVSCGQTWFFQYEPLTEQQDAEFQNRKGTKPKKVRMQKGPIKTFLTVFFDSKGIVHKEFMSADQTANADYYLDVLKRLWRKISEIREYQEQGSWSLLHDYSPEHKSKMVCDFLATNHITALEHPPYSPDLDPNDFWLFPKLKSAIKGKRYNNIHDMEQALTVALETISKEQYKDCFENFSNRLQFCSDGEGIYLKECNDK